MTSPAKAPQTKRILVPIDFTEQSEVALDQAIALTKIIHAEIVLLSVIEENSSLTKIVSKNADMAEVTTEIIKKQEDLFSKYTKYKIKMEPMVARGAVHEEISRVAKMLAPELIIMGTNGKPKDLTKRFFGSYAYRVVSDTETPVVTIHGDVKVKAVKKIVFPYLLDRKSKSKVALCLHYARIFDSEVYVVAMTDDIKEQKQLPQHVEQVKNYIVNHEVPCAWHFEENKGRSNAQAVLDYTKEIGGDMIIMMEEDRASALHLWTSDLEVIMYNADIPVMCVNPPSAKLSSGFSNF